MLGHVNKADQKIQVQPDIQSTVQNGAASLKLLLGRNRGIIVYVYERGSIWDRDFLSQVVSGPLISGEPWIVGEAAPGAVEQASQDEQETGAAGTNPPRYQLSPNSHALQCSAMYCIKGGLCCKGYRCSSSPIQFAGAVKAILLGIQASLVEMASNCIAA